MLRDAADETEDMKIVEQFDISAIDTESLKGFRNHHKSYRPEHVFNNLPDDEYLERIDAAGFGEDGKLHPTTAGLLMFGEEYHIVREFPEYFLDYREMLDPTIRWTDRLQSSSGDWSGNVFDFFFRVNSKIAKDIKKPFKLEGITRVDDTPVHKAVVQLRIIRAAFLSQCQKGEVVHKSLEYITGIPHFSRLSDVGDFLVQLQLLVHFLRLRRLRQRERLTERMKYQKKSIHSILRSRLLIA